MQLGFSVDWGGLATTLTKAGAEYATARSALSAKLAIHRAELAAQAAMAKQQALASQAAFQGAIRAPTPATLAPYGIAPPRPAFGPSWAVPAAVSVGVLAVVVMLMGRR